MKIKLILTLILVTTIMLSGCVNENKTNNNQKTDNSYPTSDDDTINGTIFPSKVGHMVKYGINHEGEYRLIEVVNKTEYMGIKVFELLYNNSGPIDHMYVDENGRIIKSWDEYGYLIFNYDNNTIYGSKYDEPKSIDDNYFNEFQLFLGSWWSQHNLTVGNSFNYNMSTNYSYNFEIVETEDVQVSAGNFSTYKILFKNLKNDDENSKDWYYWIDINTKMLVKWGNENSGDELIDYFI